MCYKVVCYSDCLWLCYCVFCWWCLPCKLIVSYWIKWNVVWIIEYCIEIPIMNYCLLLFFWWVSWEREECVIVFHILVFYIGIYLAIFWRMSSWELKFRCPRESVSPPRHAPTSAPPPPPCASEPSKTNRRRNTWKVYWMNGTHNKYFLYGFSFENNCRGVLLLSVFLSCVLVPPRSARLASFLSNKRKAKALLILMKFRGFDFLKIYWGEIYYTTFGGKLDRII